MQKQLEVVDEQKRKTADYKHPLKFCNLADTNPDLKTKNSIAYICLVYFRSVTLLPIVLTSFNKVSI
jgi:hypothetical protein